MIASPASARRLPRDGRVVGRRSWVVDGGMLQMGPMAGSHLRDDGRRDG
ncbi:hypothetical protein ACFQ34_21155 [Pseudonocardia benzenivorans]|uniref:Uncharacterized protein n=1 Tax=Pseudonocardia benzenivorans TaxID=228005 RepID=A0ABW3VN44_9PSEU|nr:hypothetical protein [Pseudonocardia dioxanivorans]